MARGGKRPGAGRPAKLSYERRLLLGAECERRFQAMWEDARHEKLERRPGADVSREVLQQLDEVRTDTQLSAADRLRFINSAEGRELLEERREAVRVMLRTPDFVEHPNLIIDRDAPRPKCVKASICAGVASEASEAWKVEVLPWAARKGWSEWRALQRRLEEDRAQEGVQTFDFGME